jgi:hypothetical protein
MKIHVLFGQRRERYEGEHAPEILCAWDEWSIEENPDGFSEAVELARKEVGEEMVATRVIILDVDGDKIRKMLVGVPRVAAEILG